MVKREVTRLWSVLWTLAFWPVMAWSQPATTAEPEKAVERDPRGASADGAYWFEVEVTIYSSVYGGGKYSEVPVADSKNLRYPGQLRRLQKQSDSYQFPFDAELAQVQPFDEGPVFSPADPTAFKILDHDRDPFMELDRRYWRFNQLNSRLQSTDEHKVLWHQVWRQPIRARGQSPSLQIEGGEMFGEHYELEGSLRVSGADNQAALEANLWLSNAARDSIWQLNQNRDLGPNALYSLDHPALGLLIELRPYLVPEPRVPNATVVKPSSKRGFE